MDFIVACEIGHEVALAVGSAPSKAVLAPLVLREMGVYGTPKPLGFYSNDKLAHGHKLQTVHKQQVVH